MTLNIYSSCTFYVVHVCICSFQGELECESETVFQLAAYVLQVLLFPVLFVLGPLSDVEVSKSWECSWGSWEYIFLDSWFVILMRKDMKKFLK